MVLQDILQKAKKEILIFGTLPIAKELIKIQEELRDILVDNENLRFSVFYESETELFNKSLILNSNNRKNRVSFVELKSRVERIKRIENYIFEEKRDKERLQNFKNNSNYNLYQINLPQKFYAIIVDEIIYYCPEFIEIPKLNDYQKITNKDSNHKKIKELIDYYSNDNLGGIYLSKPNTPKDKMLVMYDKDDYPRGIYPRNSFYNTDFQRYSTWLLIFNRKGQLLLQKRSENAKDNGSLWDKSAGGHVDIADRSSFVTAEKELIEELFMTKAEFTKHITSDSKNLINLGEWRFGKIGNESAFNAFKNFDEDDFGYFFIKKPVKRTSKRRFIDNNGKPFFKETKFISDVFLFVAPENEITNNDSLKELSKYASSGHRLITIQELKSEMNEKKKEGVSTDFYTDDLLHIIERFEDDLIQFSESIKFTF